jgi:hypothetical protein
MASGSGRTFAVFSKKHTRNSPAAEAVAGWKQVVPAVIYNLRYLFHG